MKKAAFHIARTSLFLAAGLLFGACKKDTKEELQRQQLDSYISTFLRAHPELAVEQVNGVYFILLSTDSSLLAQAPRAQRLLQPGDGVRCEYVAWTLDGTVFATSYAEEAAQRGLTPLPLPGGATVGTGSLIAGLDRGLLCMAPGDEALILFPFTLGYGEVYMGQVKPESALVFQVYVY